MNALLRIRVQKLFLVAVIVKVVSAFLGWYLQMQWSLGFALPLFVMAFYIGLGLKRLDRDVTDEKFADSCYYLGFIFTITSIVFSLFDLPSIGERIQDIAVRFGAAMVSTVAGLIVRVYLVSFRQDASDALKDAEDALLEAAQKFREQLVMAYEKLGDFQNQVTTATETSVEAVRLQVEKLGQDHSVRMERVFVELNERNQQAVTQALSEVGAASRRMSQSVDGYAESMRSNLQALGSKVDDFGDAVTRRLQTTTFPDDYFASQLAAPLEQMKAASSKVSEQVQSSASAATEAASVLTAAIRKLKTKATQVEESLDTVVRLTTAQHSLLDTSATQLEQLKKLGELLASLQQSLEASTTATASVAASNAGLQVRVTEVVSAVQTSQKAVVDAMEQVSSRLESERDAANSLGHHVLGVEVATKELAQEMRGNAAVTRQLAAKWETEAGTESKLTAVVAALQAQRESISNMLSSLDSKATGVSSEVASAMAQFGGVAERFDAIVTRLLPVPTPPTSNVFAAPSLPTPTSSLEPEASSLDLQAQATTDSAIRPASPTPASPEFPGTQLNVPGSPSGSDPLQR